MRRIAAAAVMIAGLPQAVSAASETSVQAFMLTALDMSFYRGDEKVDCPEGRSHTVREAFLATQSSSERQRLQMPEHSSEFEKKYKVDYVFGPGGRDICTDADLFDTPERETQKLLQSKIAPGMDLDGAGGDASAPGVCAHQSFNSPSGEPGIDNQLLRAVACNTFWRGGETGVGDVLAGQNWIGNPAVVLVRGVESWADDAAVEVEIAAAVGQPAVDVKNQPVPGASLTASDNPRYRVRMKGQIKDGLLTTEPADLILPFNWQVTTGGEFVVRHLRLRVRYTDGNLVGEAGGYRPIDNAIAILHVGGPGVASAAGVECASVRKTLRLLADGDRDPKTKQCTSVSSAMKFAATPAFVFDKGVLLNPAAQ
ncbi:MAG TPA: hypothetical protein VF503_16150 [Sphingobium sp.]|uniref:hypothetical protein n=1 Tax=Sphingobium sp. TaxID=1912891 RepID=UPI002ED685B0